MPSLGSISSQWTAVRTVLMCMATSRGQIGFRYSELEELELRSSPASIRNGLPSTINWVAVPCF